MSGLSLRAVVFSSVKLFCIIFIFCSHSITLFQSLEVFWHVQKRCISVSGAFWPKVQFSFSFSLILNRKLLVARRLWRNLKWNFINFVLLVHRNAKRYAELHSRFSLLKHLQSISHFFWLFLGASPLFLTKDLYTSALTFLDFEKFVPRGSCSCLLSFTCTRVLLPSALTADIRP